MVTILCSGKFHAFALAEQMEKHGLLDGFFTAYASTKNKLARHFVKRVDREIIPPVKIHTNLVLAVPIKAMPNSTACRARARLILFIAKIL